MPLSPSGVSVSLSWDGSVLAVGSPRDSEDVGAAWVFKYNGSGNYTQIGSKLVGKGYRGVPIQGKD